MNDKILEELRYYFNGYGSRHDETILKLIEQNKRYREAIKEIQNEAKWMLKLSENGEKFRSIYYRCEEALEESL